jgi:spore coat protein A
MRVRRISSRRTYERAKRAGIDLLIGEAQRRGRRMRISRKEFLKLGLAGGAALTLPFGTSGCSSGDQRGTLLRTSAPLPGPFSVPLPVPPVLEPVRTDAGTDYYEITQREGRVEILPGLGTTAWGYDGIFPGPTIEFRRGRRDDGASTAETCTGSGAG